MAIKDIAVTANLCMNVRLKTGEHFSCKDIPSDPFHVPGMVVFWYSGKIRAYPLADVEYLEMFDAGNYDDCDLPDLPDLTDPPESGSGEK